MPLLIIMSKVGSAVFDNLPTDFRDGCCNRYGKERKRSSGTFCIDRILCYECCNQCNACDHMAEIPQMERSQTNVLEGTITSVVGIQSLQMGVFGGIIVGLGVAALHNRFHKIELPNALSFFGGSRFVPIISTLVYMFVGIVMYFVWPVVQNGIYALGGLVTGSGYLGTLIFGIIKRAIDSVRTSSRILHAILADSSRWNNGSCGTDGTREDRTSSLHSLLILQISHISAQMQPDISQVNLSL